MDTKETNPYEATAQELFKEYEKRHSEIVKMAVNQGFPAPQSPLTLKNKQIEEAVSKDRERIGALLYEIDADVSDVYYKVFNPKN